MLVGSLLHLLKIPFKGLIITGIAFFFMVGLKYMVPKFGSIILAGIISICFKFISPGAYILNIILAIALEAIGWDLLYLIFKNRYIYGFISGIYTGIICSITSLLGYIFFSGLGFNEAYTIYMKQVRVLTGVFPNMINPLIIYLAINICVSIVFSLFSMYEVSKLMKRFND